MNNAGEEKKIAVLPAWIFLLIISFLSFPQKCFPTVNIETLRKTDLDEGIHLNLSGRFGILAGNSNNRNLSGNFRTDYLFDSYHLFSIVSGERGDTDNKRFKNKGYIHLRGQKTFTGVYTAETFAQEEFNEFILIEERNLFGGGIRLNPPSFSPDKENRSDFNLHLGVGLMWETERFDHETEEEDTYILRSSNYLSAKWKIKQILLFSATGYYQVDTTRASDFRILSNGSLAFDLTDKLKFTFNVVYRYDNEPPKEVENFDIEINNGFSYLY